MFGTCGKFLVPFIRVLRLTPAMVNILHLSIEEDWSQLHTFANIIWQAAGRGSAQQSEQFRGTSRLSKRGNTRLRYAFRIAAKAHACAGDSVSTTLFPLYQE